MITLYEVVQTIMITIRNVNNRLPQYIEYSTEDSFNLLKSEVDNNKIISTKHY